VYDTYAGCLGKPQDRYGTAAAARVRPTREWDHLDCYLWEVIARLGQALPGLQDSGFDRVCGVSV
jgi:hypothetical protein